MPGLKQGERKFMQRVLLSALLALGVVFTGLAQDAAAKCRQINRCDASGHHCQSKTICRNG
jgi:hypothetical protein